MEEKSVAIPARETVVTSTARQRIGPDREKKDFVRNDRDFGRSHKNAISEDREGTREAQSCHKIRGGRPPGRNPFKG